jgi:hypothetical protein
LNGWGFRIIMTLVMRLTIPALALLGLGVPLTPLARACSCAISGPLCNTNFSSVDPTRTSVFVGQVVDVRDDFQEKVKENLPPGLDPSKIRLQPQGAVPTGNHRLLLEATAKVYLDVWADLLPAAEFESIRSISDPEQVLNLEVVAKRVELEVEERFVGEPPERVTVATGMGGGDCGIPFELGKRYIVVATKGSAGVYYTGVCSQSAPVEEAPPTLAALRAWKRGEEFPRTVYGTVWDETMRVDEDTHPPGPLEGQMIRLMGESRSFETLTDEQGYFEWSNLPSGRYEIQTDRSGWTMTSRGQVDLVAKRCVSVFVTMEDGQGSQ